MRILLATMQYGRDYTQGTERYLGILSQGLRERGHDVMFLAGDPDGRYPNVSLGDAVASAPPIYHYPSHGWMSLEGLPAGALEDLLRLLRPELIHLANPAHVGVGLIDAARNLGIPLVVSVVDYWWLCPKHTLFHADGRICDARVPWSECLACIAAEREKSWRKVVARLPVLRRVVLPPAYLARWALGGVPRREIGRWPRRQRWLLNRLNDAAAVIFLSQTAADLIAPHLARPKTYVIRNGLEPEWFEQARGAAPARAEASRGNPDELCIGFAGALQPHKGAHVLLEALHRLRWTRTRVRIAGGGADEDYDRRLRKLAEGLRVEFAGRVSSREMPAYLASLDLLVTPSLCLENLPMVTLEAAAVGTPVMTSRVGGIAEIVTDPRMHFEPGSAEDLARKLEAWLAFAHELPQLPEVSTADEMLERTLAVYDAALAQKRPSAQPSATDG